MAGSEEKKVHFKLEHFAGEINIWATPRMRLCPTCACQLHHGSRHQLEKSAAVATKRMRLDALNEIKSWEKELDRLYQGAGEKAFGSGKMLDPVSHVEIE